MAWYWRPKKKIAGVEEAPKPVDPAIERRINASAELFDTIESNPLTAEQRLAVVQTGPATLVVAGAGSGKSSTVVARVAWLLCQGVEARDILVVAFNRDVKNELIDRLQQRVGAVPDVHTFHSLGLSVLAKVQGKAPLLSTLATEAGALSRWLDGVLYDLLCVPETGHVLCDAAAVKEKNRDELFLCPSLAAIRPIPSKMHSAIPILRENGGTPSGDQDWIAAMALVLKCYEVRLQDHGETDFGGLIQGALQMVATHQFKSRYKHIIVDEFQDISRGRADLIRSFCRTSCFETLFCVGDDWQSIYRFAGSDVGLMTDFGGYWGDSTRVDMTRTFRYNQRILEVSSRFIQQNPEQLKKTLIAAGDGQPDAVQLYQYKEGNHRRAFVRACNWIRANGAGSVMVLGRYHRSCPDFLEEMQAVYYDLSFRFMSIHQSKGSEDDHVILTDFHKGNLSFPAQSDRGDKSDYPFAEERRLMYVALTRARHSVHIMAPRNAKSCFVRELKSKAYRIHKHTV